MRILHSRSGKLPVVGGIAVALILCLGVGAFAFFKISKLPRAGGKKDVKLTPWELEEFVVNLADKDDLHYLKVKMVLEVEDQGKGGHSEGSVNPEEAKVRDVIISVLSKRCLGELLSETGKSTLKSDLKSALNSVLEDCKVHDIYFTSFAMQ